MGPRRLSWTGKRSSRGSNGDRELLARIAALFRENVPGQLDAIREAVLREDREQVAATAHGVRGSILNFAGGPAAEAAQRLECDARAADTGRLTAELGVLERETDRLLDALAALLEEEGACRS